MFSTVSIFWPYASHTHGAPNEADKTVTEAAAYDPYKYGLIELCGEASELEELRKLAPACNCELRPGPDGDLWLGSDKFDDAMPEQAREQATEILITLNGLARMENYRHRNVVVGDEFLKKTDNCTTLEKGSRGAVAQERNILGRPASLLSGQSSRRMRPGAGSASLPIQSLARLCGHLPMR